MRRILGAVVALLVVSVLAACGSVGDAVSSEGEGSRVVSGESSESSESSESTESAAPVADAETEAEAEAESEAEQAAVIEVVEYGFTQLPSGEYDSPPQVSYGVVFANSGDAIAVDARVQITFNGADGGVVTTQEEYLTAVLPGQQAALGASLYDTDGVASMSVQVLPGSSEPADDVAGAFEVSQVATSVEEYGGLTTTATVASPFTKDLQDLYATAIHRGPDGAIVGGDFTFLSFVPAGGTAGVEIMTAANLPEPTSSEVYVQLSGLSLME